MPTFEDDWDVVNNGQPPSLAEQLDMVRKELDEARRLLKLVTRVLKQSLKTVPAHPAELLERVDEFLARE